MDTSLVQFFVLVCTVYDTRGHLCFQRLSNNPDTGRKCRNKKTVPGIYAEDQCRRANGVVRKKRNPMKTILITGASSDIELATAEV